MASGLRQRRSLTGKKVARKNRRDAGVEVNSNNRSGSSVCSLSCPLRYISTTRIGLSANPTVPIRWLADCDAIVTYPPQGYPDSPR